jgi:hypothetical protein
MRSAAARAAQGWGRAPTASPHRYRPWLGAPAGQRTAGAEFGALAGEPMT